MSPIELGDRRWRGYHPTQIALHWLIVGLVLVQYATSGAIKRTHEAVALGQSPVPADLLLHKVHTLSGVTILAVMVLRLGLRWWFKTGKDKAQSWRERAAKAVHFSFYAVLIAQAITGLVASYLWWPISSAHQVLFFLLLALIGAHVFMAFWHQFALRDGTLTKMLKSRRRSATDSASV